MPSPHCSFPLRGKWNYCLILNFTITIISLSSLLNFAVFCSENDNCGLLPGTNVLREQIMAGSGHLQTFRLLRFLRSRNSADGHANYGIQMAVSFCLVFIRSHFVSRTAHLHCFYHILRCQTHYWIFMGISWFSWNMEKNLQALMDAKNAFGCVPWTLRS